MYETPQIKLALDKDCLLVDADGTLLDISQRPEYTQASRHLLEVLDQLYYALDGALAVISGRRIEDLDRLFAPLRLPASGIHGAQLRISPATGIADSGAPDVGAHVRRAVFEIAGRHAGVFVEDKGKALAVHWRSAPESASPLFADLAAAIANDDADLSIMRGHCVFEIKSATTTKGDAVRAFMQARPFSDRRPIFIGDDVTDIAGIAAAKALGGAAYSVGQRLAGADGVFASPAQVRAWLGQSVGVRLEARSA